jgi:hypothetical protein
MGVSFVTVMKCRLIKWLGYREHGTDEKCLQNFSEHEGKRPLGKIILKLILRTWSVRMWSG